ncbi:pentatricopeptide repeat-containing protein At3g29290 isoform X3 [Mangifera indica]|uniref:pentatricopeptide repeat-containing protein At3g29290 isoform X3 n=1 Tax=Mangifera indica TaxID=29780 RepID=UPI001CFA8CC1|nr:pentatricopeptide repeat-containing protein At3g29290 isoform X3 [Mangifera indica]
MGEVLMNSGSVMMISNGFACLSSFDGRPSSFDYGFCSRNYDFCIFQSSAVRSKGGHVWFGCMRIKSPQTGSIIAANMVESMEPELDYENEEDDQLTEQGKEDFDLVSLGQNLPPWGNVEVQQVSDLECKSCGQALKAPQKAVIGREIRVYMLEERNEEVLSRRVLMLSRSNKVRSALELFESMKLADLRPSVHACNSLLSCLLRNELLDNALRVFEFMRINEITTGHSYSLILKAIANARGSDFAVNMFIEFGGYTREMKVFDVIVYNTMISICGRVNNWIETEKLWISMRENDLIGTQVTYSLLVCIFVRCGQNDLALDAYNEMILHRFTPGDDVMQAVIGSCAKEGKWDLALNHFQDMLNSGLQPNLITCNALIISLAKAGKVKLAFKVHGMMKLLGHSPDVYTWKALLSALYKANQHADVLQLFESVKREQSCELNEHLYNTALMSCQKLGLWEKALQLLWQMEASGDSVSTSSYNLVIGACESARKPKVALQVYKHMIHQKCTPDTFTYLSLIRSCIWGSLWTEVEQILDVNPDVSIYNAAIQGMCLRRKFDSAKKMYERMCKSGLKPDGKTRALMLQNLGKQ